MVAGTPAKGRSLLPEPFPYVLGQGKGVEHIKTSGTSLFSFTLVVGKLTTQHLRKILNILKYHLTQSLQIHIQNLQQRNHTKLPF